MPDTPAAVEASPPRSLPLKLWAAVLQAQRTLEPVAKDKTATVATKSGSQYTYKFASTEDMMQAAREALLAAGVMAQRFDYRVEAAAPADRGQQPGPPIVLSFFRLVHPESGEVEDFPPLAMPITSHNAPDKALAGALTYAWAYWLRDVLCIPREDENEPDRRKRDDGETWHGRGGDRGTASKGRQPSGKRDEQPATERRVVKADTPETAAKPEPAKSSKPSAGTPEADAHAALVEAAKAYIEACKRIDSKPQLYEVVGAAALGKGQRWNPRDTHTVEQYAAGTEGLRVATAQLLGEADPNVCSLCKGVDGQHTADCPDAPRAETTEREPGEDDE